jgi:ElaB/YqjD/DUF883 family membrane-anchored ribosome-binding protein
MSDKEQSFDAAWDEAFADPTEAKQEEDLVQPEVEDQPNPSETPQTNEEDSGKVEPEQQETDFEALYKQEVQKTKSWEGRIRKANQLKAEADEEVARLRAEIQQTRQSVKPPVDEQGQLDDATLEAFVKEFPDLHAPLLSLVRKEAKALVSQELGEIKPAVEEIKDSKAKRAARQAEEIRDQHFQDIRSKHSDFDALVENGTLREWIDTKPLIFQESLNRVAAKGTAEEVIEMFDQLKADLGLKSPHNPTKGDKRDKLKSMVAVRGSAPVIPRDKPAASDYDAAWEEATRTR